MEIKQDMAQEMASLFDNYQRRAGGGSGGGRKTIIDVNKFTEIVAIAKAKIVEQKGKPAYINIQTIDKYFGLSVKHANSVIKNVRANKELETILKNANVSIGSYGVSIAKGQHGVSFSLGYIGKL
jgi:hypothetical protein